jgi:hypothetical protein
VQEVGKGLDDGGATAKQFETADTSCGVVQSASQRNVRDPSGIKQVVESGRLNTRKK